jgi:multidrug transporter EmrE-like cation transporter
MQSQQINFTNDRENSFTISVKKTSKFARIILIFTFLIFLIMPIIFLTFMIIERAELKIGIFFSFALFWGFAYYMFRVISWNQFGKEFFTIENDKIKYYSDFKYFKDSFKEIENNDIKIEFENIGYLEENLGVLSIKNKSDSLKSVIKVPILELNELIKKIKTTPNTL